MSVFQASSDQLKVIYSSVFILGYFSQDFFPVFPNFRRTLLCFEVSYLELNFELSLESSFVCIEMNPTKKDDGKSLESLKQGKSF